MPTLEVTHRFRGSQSIVIIWILSRLGVLAIALLGAWLINGNQLTAESTYTMWDHFESLWYSNIAQFGYVGEGDFQYNTAYFPGTALIMRLGLLLGLDPAFTGMLVSVLAGGAAAIALGRLAQDRGASPQWTVIAWVAAPTVVFITAPWSEALFAAFAFSSWYFSAHQRWWVAGLLASGAAFTRINGVFLGIGLIAVWWFASPRRRIDLVPLALPFVTIAAHFAYLWTLTGRWDEWRAVQREFWKRETVDPLTALSNTWQLIFDFTPGTISTRFIAEIAGGLLIVLGLAVLVKWKWWPEVIYVGLTFASLATSSFYYSIPRTITLLFPLWIIMGIALTRWRGLRPIYMLIVLPITALVTIRFVDGQWIS